MSPAEHEARNKATETLHALYGRFGAGFVLETIGKRIHAVDEQFHLNAEERGRVNEWAHDMLERGLQS
jgi:hypothetical protein